ncbi:MAG TPA: Uma2 family endonuclease [Steroidobacteraceae bacterium]|jgi:Uma2 family endonuclease
MSVPHSPGKITVDEYYEMARVGLLDPHARVELIEGEIVAMAPIGNPHGYVVDELTDRLAVVVHGRALLRVQGALRMSNRTELMPDLSLLRLPSEQYRARQASASDALLVIEVSDTTVRKDTRVKVPLYARHGVPEVWIVDLQKKCFRFYRSPQDGQYQEVSVTSDPEIATIPGLGGARIELAKLLDS